MIIDTHYFIYYRTAKVPIIENTTEVINMRVFQGENPSALQLEILNEIMASGDEVMPRGKKVREIRPASVEFLDPLKRVTFVRGRRINPFFQIAESLWILSGRSDVAFLDLFNKNMVQFSDDGKFFNASYGERMRTYGKNDLHKTIYNPVDQLADAYIKLTADKDSRQAVIVLSNPHFDNAQYTIGEKGRDIACNLILTFKIRDNKLNLCVFNRSNDLIWGLFGANIVQFTTIQEMLANWLGVEVGTYHQITDSLHVYTEDYGASGNKAIFDAHPGIEKGEYQIWDMVDCEENVWWNFDTEPRMNQNKEMSELFMEFFWTSIYPKIADDDFISTKGFDLLDILHNDPETVTVTDDYWRMAISSMVAYRFIRMKNYSDAVKVMRLYVPNSSWKVSMVNILKGYIEKAIKNESDDSEVLGQLAVDYREMTDDIVENCTNSSDYDLDLLVKYLELEV